MTFDINYEASKKKFTILRLLLSLLSFLFFQMWYCASFALQEEKTGKSGILESIYQTTRRHIPEE